MAVEFTTEGAIAIVTINRPEGRNAVDQPTAAALAAALRRFDSVLRSRMQDRPNPRDGSDENST